MGRGRKQHRREMEALPDCSSRWTWPKRIELSLYASIVLRSFWCVLYRGLQLSREFDDGGERQKVLRRLRPGWISDRRVDLSDAQWGTFRGSMAALSLAMAAFAAGSLLVQRTAPHFRTAFNVVFAAVYVGYAHGAFSAFPVALVLLNYLLAHSTKSMKHGLALVWLYNCASLWLARAYSGFIFRDISPGLAMLDKMSGPQRWHICYNMVMLRCISFASDLRQNEASGQRRSTKEEYQKTEKRPMANGTVSYGLATYMSYVFYPPLYIAGPIIGFESFSRQVGSNQRPKWTSVVSYGARLAFAFLILEAMTHALYFNAIAQQRVWKRWPAGSSLAFTPFDMGVTGFWVLNFMWLKFLVIWRFFRFWSLVEGVEPPENMLRCVNNNYNAEGFWRGWHASYNRWLVKYIYIPLGGASTRLVNIWVIFTFVALWHDVEWKLLGWAWITCIFFLPEMAAKWICRQEWVLPHHGTLWFRLVCGAAAACNIAVLMGANMVGFVTGLDGMPDFLASLSSDGSFVLAIFVTFFASAEIMFELRNHEVKPKHVSGARKE